ncbi:hypothetical protein QQ008_15805 [Fulvivirgaceae bacterium BMA10]|uniref:Uncharacterized protein n=1 Tax=Splendidivirga corallicola TaxID=3051826 RepID=A0ABT8KQ32_9BACT|nr:hypothetical protein [Fulvivirgaceae bacterium BMA10]
MNRKTRNKISTTRSNYGDVFVLAALSFIAADSTSNSPKILNTSVEQSVNLPLATPTSTRFNNANRYSLDKLRSNKKILKNLANLKSNWNGYNGEPIDKSIIEKTEHLISELDFQPQVFPTGRGTIQIEYFKDDNNLIEVEISEGEQFMYKIEDGSEFEGDVSVEELSEIISNFYA